MRILVFVLLVAAETAVAQQLTVESVDLRQSAAGPAVLLRVGDRALPVFIDPFVAQSIHGALGGQKFARPLSHDLMHNILTGLDARVSRVVVTLREGIYYGELTVTTGGATKVFDARSSDAIALAVHAKAPIIISRQLLDSAGIDMQEPRSGKK